MCCQYTYVDNTYQYSHVLILTCRYLISSLEIFFFEISRTFSKIIFPVTVGLPSVSSGMSGSILSWPCCLTFTGRNEDCHLPVSWSGKVDKAIQWVNVSGLTQLVGLKWTWSRWKTWTLCSLCPQFSLTKDHYSLLWISFHTNVINKEKKVNFPALLVRIANPELKALFIFFKVEPYQS